MLDDPLDALVPGSFDLVCSRLLLFWLAGKQETAIRRMVECLRPGGWLVDEDGDWGMVLPVDLSHPLSTKYNAVWGGGEWWASRGYDPIFGRKLPVLFEDCGLENIRHEANTEVVRGGSMWARWWVRHPGRYPRMRAKCRQSDSHAGRGIQGTHGTPDGPIILVYDRTSSCLLGPASRALITPFIKRTEPGNTPSAGQRFLARRHGGHDCGPLGEQAGSLRPRMGLEDRVSRLLVGRPRNASARRHRGTWRSPDW